MFVESAIEERSVRKKSLKWKQIKNRVRKVFVKEKRQKVRIKFT